MPTVNEVTISGAINTPVTINGDLSKFLQTVGSLSNQNQISGNASFPSVIDRTAIHYDYTEAWNAHPELVAQEGHLYIYRDYEKRENPDGTIADIPAIKIGDGTSYLIDMPFLSTGDDEAWIDHINNWSIHVSGPDRTNWNDKVTAEVIEAEETLILST